MKRMQMALAGLAILAVAGLGVSSAEARRGHSHGGSHYSFGFSTGALGYRPAPYYYAPRPVVYPAYAYPAPAYYAPAPAYYAPAYVAPYGGSSFSFSYSK